MSVDREYKVRISTVTEGNPGQTAEGLKQVGKGAEQASEQMKLLETKGREWHKLVGELDRIMPGFGQLLRVAFNPVSLGVTALVMSVELLKGVIDRHKAQMEELRQTAAATWIAEREGAEAAAKSVREFWESMKASVDASGDVKKQLDDSEKLLEAMVQSHKQILEALENEELAQAAGDKDKEEAIKKRYEALKREYDLTAESMKLEKQRDDLTKRKFELGPKFKDAAVQAQADLDLENAREDKGGDIAKAKGRMDGKDEAKLKLAADAARVGLDDIKRLASFTADTPEGEETVGRAREEVERREKLIATFEQFERDKKAVADHTDAAKRLTTEKNKAVSQVQENNDAIKEETEAVKSGEDILNVHRQTDRKKRDIEAYGAAGGVDASLSGGLSALETLYKGQKLDQKGQQQYAALHAVFDSVDGHFDRILQILYTAHQQQASRDQRLAMLETMFKNLSERSGRPIR